MSKWVGLYTIDTYQYLVYELDVFIPNMSDSCHGLFSVLPTVAQIHTAGYSEPVCFFEPPIALSSRIVILVGNLH